MKIINILRAIAGEIIAREKGRSEWEQAYRMAVTELVIEFEARYKKNLTQCGHDKCEEAAALVVKRMEDMMKPPKCLKRIIKITDKIFVQVFE